MKRKDNPMLIQCNDWKNLIYELEHKYTTSIKMACRLLKCERKWLDRYIRPHVHYIYLSNGRGRGSINYLFRASIELRKDITESIWLDTQEFECLVKKYMHDCTRQTINVPIELLIQPGKIRSFQKSYKTILDKIEKAKKNKRFEELTDLNNQKNNIIKNNLSDTGKKAYYRLPDQYKRTNSKAVECPVPSFNLNELQAVHDIMDYGDSAEEIYRSLFKAGCYKLKLHIPDEDGCISDKIYYLNHKDVINLGYESIDSILINYYNYIQFPDNSQI